MERIRVGILANDLDGFGDWELRAFEKIATDDRFCIAAIILDGRAPEGLWVKIRRKIKGRRFVSTSLYSVVTFFERKLFGSKSKFDAVNFRKALPEAGKVDVFPTRRGYVDFFSAEDSQKIAGLDLDVILRHGFNIIKGDVIKAAKFGIWSFHHADNRVFRGSPAGFWEVYYRTPKTGVTLQILNEELDGGEVIGRAFYSTKWNATLNNQAILENSVSLLWKTLERLRSGKAIEGERPVVYSGRLFRAPSGFELLVYLCRILSAAVSKGAPKIWERLGFRSYMWSLCFGKGPFEQAALWRTVEIEPAKGEFWADPFLIRKDGTLYVFFENYVYSEKKGKISVGTWDGKKFTCLGDALNLDYHLSFPFVFEDGGELFMVPEAYAARQVEVWRCTAFPFEWEPYASALHDRSVADTVLFKRNGEWWMFANIASGPYEDHNNELHVFKVDGPALREVTPHRQNPVVVDSEFARNGGRIFETDGRLFRASQNNTYGIYGYGLNLMEVTSLSLDDYEERPVQRVYPHFKNRQLGTHHLDISDDVFVVDVCRKFRR